MKDSLLAFLDVETTGFDPERHEIVQIGIVLAKQNPRPGKGPELTIVEEIDLKIKPEHIETADEEALRINGYNEGEWMFAPDLKPTMEMLSKKLDGAILVAHNLAFDNSFMEAAWKKTGVENTMKRYKLDTISIAFARFYERDGDMRYSLGYLCDIFGIKNENAHTALADAKALYQVYKKMMNA
jgi:DNA polymerase III epsilon subunit-like protein